MNGCIRIAGLILWMAVGQIAQAAPINLTGQVFDGSNALIARRKPFIASGRRHRRVHCDDGHRTDCHRAGREVIGSLVSSVMPADIWNLSAGSNHCVGLDLSCTRAYNSRHPRRCCTRIARGLNRRFKSMEFEGDGSAPLDSMN